jgi:hypothetical protein
MRSRPSDRPLFDFVATLRLFTLRRSQDPDPGGIGEGADPAAENYPLATTCPARRILEAERPYAAIGAIGDHGPGRELPEP